MGAKPPHFLADQKAVILPVWLRSDNLTFSEIQNKKFLAPPAQISHVYIVLSRERAELENFSHRVIAKQLNVCVVPQSKSN